MDEDIADLKDAATKTLAEAIALEKRAMRPPSGLQRVRPVDIEPRRGEPDLRLVFDPLCKAYRVRASIRAECVQDWFNWMQERPWTPRTIC